jgi:NTP pyrophosphatase (non-canonical NTP hydrolase)
MIDKAALIKRAIAVYGVQSQFRQFHEEVGELMVAISHYQRKRCSLDDVIVEISDVLQMIEAIKVLFNIDENRLNEIDIQQWTKLQTQMDELERKRAG